jgi:hypothetical protein
MRTLVERGCGLDVHQAVIPACARTACLLIGKAGRRVRQEVRSFTTTTAGLLALRDWLKEAGCTHVGMESTGVYWRPVYAILEDDFEVVVGNAQRIKNVPGRKTDVKDAEWIADPVRHGLIPPSFVPARPLRILRDLLRFRRSLIEARSNCRNRILKVLESANIKLASVASDVFGVSGMAMLEALVAGTMTPAEIANLARGRLRKKLGSARTRLARQLRRRPPLHARAVARQPGTGRSPDNGYRGPHHRPARTLPARASAADDPRRRSGGGRHDDRRARHRHDPVRHRRALGRLVQRRSRQQRERGKASTQRRARRQPPSQDCPLHRGGLAGRTKDTYLCDKYHRIKARGGPGRAPTGQARGLKAQGAVAHKIVIAAFHILTTGKPHHDLGGDYLDKRTERRTKQRLIQRLHRMGYHVTVQPVAA